MEELKPCPFCGAEPKMIQIKNGFMIKCPSCLIQKRQKVLRLSLEWLSGEMIKDWNTRTEIKSQSAPQPEKH